MKNISGFTIVELLVVIVVIGVLASITVVAYNGIQDSARNSNIRSAMDAVEKAFRLHVEEFGTYPRPSDVPGVGSSVGIINVYTCIQPAANGWPAKDGLTSSQCAVVAGSQPTRYGHSALVQQALLAQMSKIPDTSEFTQSAGVTSVRGIFYKYIEDPTSARPKGTAELMYFIKDNQTCVKGIKFSSPGLANCVVNLP